MSKSLHDINQHSNDNINYRPNDKYDFQSHMNYSGSKSKQTKRNKHASEKTINQSYIPRIKDYYFQVYQPNIIPFLPYAFQQIPYSLNNYNSNNSNSCIGDLIENQSEKREQLKRIEERINRLKQTSREMNIKANSLRKDFGSRREYYDDESSLILPKIALKKKKPIISKRHSSIYGDEDEFENEFDKELKRNKDEDEKEEGKKYSYYKKPNNNLLYAMEDMKNSVVKDNEDMHIIEDDLSEMMNEFQNRLKRINHKHSIGLRNLNYILSKETKNSMFNIHSKHYHNKENGIHRKSKSINAKIDHEIVDIAKNKSPKKHKIKSQHCINKNEYNTSNKAKNTDNSQQKKKNKRKNKKKEKQKEENKEASLYL